MPSTSLRTAPFGFLPDETSFWMPPASEPICAMAPTALVGNVERFVVNDVMSRPAALLMPLLTSLMQVPMRSSVDL